MNSDHPEGPLIFNDQDVDPIHLVSLGQSKLSQILWRILGILFVLIGGVGVIVPGLPTTVFMILAAACFARSSQEFYNWVISNRIFGSSVRRFREGKGMSQPAKRFALLSMWFFILVSCILLWQQGGFHIIVLTLVLAVIGTLYILRLPTDHQGKRE